MNFVSYFFVLMYIYFLVFIFTPCFDVITRRINISSGCLTYKRKLVTTFSYSQLQLVNNHRGASYSSYQCSTWILQYLHLYMLMYMHVERACEKSATCIPASDTYHILYVYNSISFLSVITTNLCQLF